MKAANKFLFILFAATKVFHKYADKLIVSVSTRQNGKEGHYGN